MSECGQVALSKQRRLQSFYIPTFNNRRLIIRTLKLPEDIAAQILRWLPESRGLTSQEVIKFQRIERLSQQIFDVNLKQFLKHSFHYSLKLYSNAR